MACTLAPIDESMKACPCAPGYVCDEELTQTCYRPMNANQDCVPAVTVTDFDADWATQNSIHWRWTPVGDPDELLRYELHVVPMAERFRRRVIGPEENSELGDFHRRSSSITDVLVDTITYEHEPDTEYIGRLVAIDRNLCEFRSEIRGASTLPPPTAEIDLFGPCLGEDFAPPSLVFMNRGGDCVFSHTPVHDTVGCTARHRAEGECGQNLKWNHPPHDPLNLDGNQFNRAVFEVVVANRTSLAASWGRIWLSVASEGWASEDFELEPMTIEVGQEFRSLQVPLRVLRGAGGDLILERFNGARITQVNIGGGFGVCGLGEAVDDCLTDGVVLVDGFRIVY